MKGEFLTAINLLSNERGVPTTVVVEALESALVAAYKRNTSETTEVVATIDPNTGEAHVRVGKIVVADAPETADELTLDAAHLLDPDAGIRSCARQNASEWRISSPPWSERSCTASCSVSSSAM